MFLLIPLKPPESQRFSDVFREIKKDEWEEKKDYQGINCP